MRARARSSRRSLGAVFAAPIASGVASVIGLVAALTGDGARDAIAWAGLGLPVAAAAWAFGRRRC
jgi:hypothetical protein